MQAVCDSAVQEHFDALTDSSADPESGLLLGHFAQGKAYIIGVVPTPRDSESKDANIDLTHRGRKWIFGHAEMIARMSVGGIEVIGSYVYAAEQDLRSMGSKGHLESLAFGLPTTADFDDDTLASGIKRLLLTVPMSRSYECKLFSSSTNKMEGHPGKTIAIKSQRIRSKLYCVQTVIEFDEIFEINPKTRPVNISKAFRGLDSCLIVLNDTKNGSYTLNTNDMKKECEKVFKSGGSLSSHSQRKSKKSQKKSKTKSSENQTNTISFIHVVSFDNDQGNPADDFTHLNSNTSQNISDEKETKSAILVRCRGLIEGRSFTLGKSSVNEAVDTLKKDMRRSMKIRLKMVEEELEDEDEDDDRHDGCTSDMLPVSFDESRTFRLPRRIFFTFENSIVLSDYISRSEDESECKKSISEVLQLENPILEGLEIDSKNDDEKSLLKPLGPVKATARVFSNKIDANETAHLEPQKKQASQDAALMIGAFVALIAAILAGLFLILRQ